MAQYDWMKSQEFKNRIQSRVEYEAFSEGMERYQTNIVDLLFEYSKENSRLLTEGEMRKEASKRRSEEDALESVSEIIKVASQIAREDQRTLLKESDFRQAYRARYCRIWPFCK